MIVPGSTLATLSITYFTPCGFPCTICRHRCPPPPTMTASLSATNLLPCYHHLLPHPLAVAAVVRHCSTLPPIACHRPPPPLPDAAVARRRRLPAVFPAIIDRCRHRPTQSSTSRCTSSYSEVYAVYILGPPIQKIGDGAELKAGTTKRDPEAVRAGI